MHPVSRTISINPRNEHFHFCSERSESGQHHWHGNDPAKTIIFNAMSVMFPEGEKFVIDTVRAVRDEVSDLALREQIDGLIIQEATHTREHNGYNSMLAKQGYRVFELYEDIRKTRRRIFSKLDVSEQLACTAAMEHLTAVLARLLLFDDSFLDGADLEYAKIWIWHAVEEIEHKAVAYDTFQHIAAKNAYLGKGYFRRCWAMFLPSRYFLVFLFKHIRWMLKDAGLSGSPRVWLGVILFLFVRPGLLRRAFLPWCKWFIPGFHPWQEDDRAGMSRWEEVIKA